MQLKKHKTWGVPVLVTFDGGAWYWDSMFERVVFVPHGHRRSDWRLPPVTAFFHRAADNNYRGAARLALRSELKRLGGEYEYEVNEEARERFFHDLLVTLGERMR